MLGTKGLELTMSLKKRHEMKLMNEFYNIYTPVKPEGQAQGCILWRSMVTNPLRIDSPVRMWAIIVIMLAYLYCTAYTRMTINESSPLCKQRRNTFNDDGQRVQLARPELPAPYYICMYRLLPTTPHHRPGIITLDLLPVSIYRPRKDG